MAQADAQVIVPRRNFLIRAFGITAAGATMALPIVTAADARARAELHLKELHKALRDLYPSTTFTVRHEFPEAEYADPRVLQDCPLVVLVADKWERKHYEG
jgi:hypothetical protein